MILRCVKWMVLLPFFVNGALAQEAEPAPSPAAPVEKLAAVQDMAAADPQDPFVRGLKGWMKNCVCNAKPKNWRAVRWNCSAGRAPCRTRGDGH